MAGVQTTGTGQTGRLARTVLRAVFVLALLYAFLVAIQLMGSAFKLLGSDFAESLVTATRSPVTGLFIGILSTALIQSSSVTTSMVVGLVSADALPLSAGIPIVMGANIGTSVTNLLVSLGHMGNREEFRRAYGGAVVHDAFNWLTVLVLLPLELATGYLEHSATWLATHLYGTSAVKFESPLKAIVKPVSHAVEHVATGVIGLAEGAAGAVILVLALLLIFLCLTGLVKLLKALMSQRLESLVHRALSKGAVVTMGIGLVVTAAVQSSSITTSILVPLVATGLISLEHAYPITLGANVGTTVTALLAALAGNVMGLAIALVHVLFNLSGILLFYPLPAARRIPIAIARWMGGIAAKHRAVAILVIVVVFFLIPLGVILIERAVG